MNDPLLQTIERRVEELRGLLAYAEAAHKAYLRQMGGKPDRTTAATKYAGTRPLFAIEDYLRGEGEPRSFEEIQRALLAGGANLDAYHREKRKGFLEHSVRANLAKGNFIKQKNGLIGLPEWKK